MKASLQRKILYLLGLQIMAQSAFAVLSGGQCLAQVQGPIDDSVQGTNRAPATPVYENQSDIGKQLLIPVHSWTNPHLPVKGVIVALQGLIFSGKMFSKMATHFTDKGYIVYANDMRGFGDWRNPSHTFAGDSNVHFGQSKDDLTSILKALRKKYADKPIILIGESFGANMAIWEASTDPSLLDGAVASGAVFRTRVHPRPLWVKTFFQGIHNPDNNIDIKPYMQPILSEDKKIAKQLMDNTETVKEMSVTNLIKAAVTNKNSVKEIAYIPESMPILLLAGEKDRVQKTDTLSEMVAKMGSKETSLVVFPGKGHMLLECDEIDPEVYKEIDNWLDHREGEFAMKLANPSPTASSSIESTPQTSKMAEPVPADAFSKIEDRVSSN